MSKKYVISSYQLYENDAFKDYLEHMALKGWRLTKFGSFLLHFESCEPHPIRYCAEVMEKPSAFASNQTLPLRRYREFCKDAGWSYVGTNGLLHVFCTEDMEAIPVETNDPERYEHICKAFTGNIRITGILFVLLILMNLSLCYQQGTLLSNNGFISLILALSILYCGGDYYLWKRKARRSMEQTRTLPKLSWKTVYRKNMFMIVSLTVLVILFLMGTLLSSSALSPLAVKAVAVYLIVYILMLAVFSALLHWLREKKTFSTGTNIAIYWGVAFVLIFLIVGICSALIFRFL